MGGLLGYGKRRGIVYLIKIIMIAAVGMSDLDKLLLPVALRNVLTNVRHARSDTYSPSVYEFTTSPPSATNSTRTFCGVTVTMLWPDSGQNLVYPV